MQKKGAIAVADLIGQLCDSSLLIMSKDYKKDIFSILADGVELLHKRLRLLYITFNFKAADKNYLYFLF